MEFTKVELQMMAKALAQAEQSAKRLAVKEGQPEGVAKEYAAYQVAVSALQTRINAELVSSEKVKK